MGPAGKGVWLRRVGVAEPEESGSQRPGEPGREAGGVGEVVGASWERDRACGKGQGQAGEAGGAWWGRAGPGGAVGGARREEASGPERTEQEWKQRGRNEQGWGEETGTDGRFQPGQVRHGVGPSSASPPQPPRAAPSSCRFWFRLYWFPLKVLYATSYCSLRSVPDIPFYFFFNALLLLLTLMNLYWFLVSGRPPRLAARPSADAVLFRCPSPRSPPGAGCLLTGPVRGPP